MIEKYKLFLDDCENILVKAKNDCIDLIITDIPYGINYKSNRQNRCGRTGTEIKTNKTEYFSKINNDTEIPTEWLKDAYRILKNDSAMYIFVHWSTWSKLEDAVKNAGFNVKNMIVMNKSNHGMGDLKGDYAPKHELVMFCSKGRHILNKPNGRPNNVIDVPVKFSGSIRLHPNEKPLCWIEPFILESSKEQDLVLDPFMGSASTGKAARKLNRRFIGIDNDEKYYNIALEEMKKYDRRY